VPRVMGLDQSPAERELSDQLREYHGGGSAPPEVLAHERALNRIIAAQRNQTGDVGAIWREERAAGHLKDSDIDSLADRMNTPYLARVKALPLPRAVAVLEKASTPQEQAIIRDAISGKLDQLQDMSAADRSALWARMMAAQKKTLPAKNTQGGEK